MTENTSEMGSDNEDLKKDEDSDKFNDVIQKSNKEGNHEEIYTILQPGSSLSINILFVQ